MRHADFVKKDAQNILDEKYTSMTGLITQEIEKAAGKGFFSAYVLFGNGLDQDTITYLKGVLERNGYEHNFHTEQMDGTTLKVSW